MTHARKLRREVLWGRRYTAVGSALIFGVLIAGCAQAPEGEVHSRKVQHATVQQAAAPLVKLTLPAGGDVRQFGLVANGSLELRDRARVRDQQGAPLDVHNLGTVPAPNPATAIGGWDNTPGYAVGDLISRGPVLLRDRAKVGGDVITAGTITKQNQVVIAGTQQAGATLPAPLELSFSQPIVADPARPPVVLPVDSTQVLEPGAYSQVIAYPRSTLVLKSGSYAFSSFQLEPQAKLQLQVDPTKGPVAIYVDNVLAWRGTTVAGATDSLLLVYQGTQSLKFEQKLAMAVVAPNASVTLATGGLTHAGSLYAKGISLDPDVRFNYVPFKYWDWVLPPKPFVSCVYPAGGGTYMAAFGYENARMVALEIAAGPGNVLTPDPGTPYNPVVHFLPGRHDRSLWVPMPVTGLTWNVLGQSVTATLSSPPCELVPSDTNRGPISEGRPVPRLNLPPMPTLAAVSDVFTNATGPGYFDGVEPADNSGAPTNPNLPAEKGNPPQVPPGLTEDPLLPLTLSVALHLHDDSGFEKVDLEGYTSINGDATSWSTLPASGAQVSRTVMVPRNAPAAIDFQFVERNLYKAHESIKVNAVAHLEDPTPTVSGVVESAKITKNWVFGLPLSVDSYELQNSLTVLGTLLGSDLAHGFEGDNVAVWSISSPATSGSGVKVCANWSTYFVDEDLPTVDGIKETYVGTPIGSNGRAVAYPAAFAPFTLMVKGTTASYSVNGILDRDGCVADVPANAFIYRDDVTDGSSGGMSLYLNLSGDLTITTGGGAAHFPITQDDVVFEQVFQATRFDNTDNPWPLQDGYRVPPDRIDLTSNRIQSAGAMTAASISHALRRFSDLGITLPSGKYTVALDDGTATGTKDYEGKDVGDSFFGGGDPDDPTDHGTLHIGPGYFPYCGEEEGSPIDCRTPCGESGDCGGGQMCAVAGNPTKGCQSDDTACFCAYPVQSVWKFTVTHELGHMIQEALTGKMQTGGYGFSCEKDSEGKCLTTLGKLVENSDRMKDPFLADPPLMDEACGCQHVNLGGNPRHCLQSIEVSSTADGEGFGQFFSSLMWNDPQAEHCRFNYYKEVLDVGADTCRIAGDPLACKTFAFRNGDVGTITLPPVPVDCKVSAKWRNTQRCAVDSRTNLPKGLMGTEYDWMTFLYAVNAQLSVNGQGGLNELGKVYNYACHPDVAFDANDPSDTRMVLCGAPGPDGKYGRPIGWVDMQQPSPTQDDDPNTPPVTIEHGGFLSGAERKWGPTDQRTTDIEAAGLEHGVDENTEPLDP